jgi:hypothetical protein
VSLVKEFADMCHDTIVVEAPLNVDSTMSSVTAYGVRLMATATTTYPCRIVGKPKVVVNAQGQTAVSLAQIFVMADVQIDPRSRITLSSVCNGCTSTPDIINVTYYPDADAGGLSHPTVFV